MLLLVSELWCDPDCAAAAAAVQARAWGGGKQHFVGSFTSEMDAARAYDKVGRGCMMHHY
jgi:hypothetical protein